MSAFLWAALGVLGGFGLAAIGDMVSEEVRDRLDHLPQALLRLAAMRLDASERAILYEDVWLPDLAYFLRGDEARPVTRLYHGIGFAVGIMLTARRSIGPLKQAAPPPPLALDDALAFDRIVPRSALRGNAEFARLSDIIHDGGQGDRKTRIFAGLDRQIIEMKIYADTLSNLLSKTHIPRRGRREMRKCRDRSREILCYFSEMRDELEAQFEERFGEE